MFFNDFFNLILVCKDIELSYGTTRARGVCKDIELSYGRTRARGLKVGVLIANKISRREIIDDIFANITVNIKENM